MHTRKVGSAGRFGNKYGSKIRVAVAKAEADSRASHQCPLCLNKKLIRKAAGIWTCLKCNTAFAGGAYSPTTAATKIMSGEVAAFAEEAAAEPAKESAAVKTKSIDEASKHAEAKPKKEPAAKKKKAKAKKESAKEPKEGDE